MIIVMNHDGTREVPLTRVDQMSSADNAAQLLWESVHAAAKVHGGAAFLFTPSDRAHLDGGWAVVWNNGPAQWAQAYVVGEGADAREFVATAEDDFTVVFRDTD